MKKELFAAATLVLGSSALFAGTATDAMTTAPTVLMTALSARQRYPWNGKVDIDFSFTCDIPEAFAFINFKASYVDRNGNTVEVPMRTFEQFETAFCTNAGTYRVTWDSTADAPNLVTTNLRYAVTANMAKYMVVDLSKGSEAAADNPYPVSYLEECPDPTRDDGGWTDEYKTTKMVFRLVQPGTYVKGWNNGGFSYYNEVWSHQATITRPFYLAIFECTQGQAKQVMGSYFGNQTYEFKGAIRDRRPVGCASLVAWRGSGADGFCWPNDGSKVLSSSFIGQFREKTGNNGGFDLPTDTEWEFAARAGSTDAWGGDGLMPADNPSDADGPTGGKVNTVLKPLGRYMYNGGYIDNGDGTYTKPGYDDEVHGTAVVGSYKPNAWGFYDMLGNMRELTLDQCGQMPQKASVDELGPIVADPSQSASVNRITRGGAWAEAAKTCALMARSACVETYTSCGVRLAWHFPIPSQVK